MFFMCLMIFRCLKSKKICCVKSICYNKTKCSNLFQMVTAAFGEFTLSRKEVIEDEKILTTMPVLDVPVHQQPLKSFVHWRFWRTGCDDEAGCCQFSFKDMATLTKRIAETHMVRTSKTKSSYSNESCQKT